MKKLIFIFTALSLLIPMSVSAAGVSCTSYRVKDGDTLNIIAKAHNVDVESFVKTAHIFKDAPNKNNRRSIYVGQELCVPKGIPEWNARKHLTWADWPAANYAAVIDGKNLVFNTWWFNYPTAYNVKVNGKKISGLLSVKYHRTASAVVLPKNLAKLNSMTVCIKSVTTDALVCRVARRIR